MSTIYNLKIRSISLIVLVCFCVSDLAQAAPALPQIPFWNSSISKVDNQVLLDNPSQINIPFDSAHLKEIHHGTNNKLIIHVQDAHSNFSGQQNLSRTLDHIMSRYDIPLVLVEGGDRDVSLNEVKKIADKASWKVMAKRLMYEGLISGEEHLNLVSDHQMILRGIEYLDLYDENLEAYAKIADNREEILKYIHHIQLSLERIKNKFYPRNVLNYENRKKLSHTHSIQSPQQYEQLIHLALSHNIRLKEDFPTIEVLRSLQSLEASLDHESLKTDQSQFFDSLNEGSSAEDLSNLMREFAGSRTSAMSQYILLNQLMSIADDEGIDWSIYSHLIEYHHYLKRFVDLDKHQLLDELDDLEKLVYERILSTGDQKKIRAIDEYLGLLKNAYSIQMTYDEYQELLSQRPQFETISWQAFLNQKVREMKSYKDLVSFKSDLDESEEDLGHFYKLVQDRDHAFYENSNRIMKELNQDIAFVITGGYHTENLMHKFREEGYSYIVLTPIVRALTNHAKYEELLLAPIQLAKKHGINWGSESGAGPKAPLQTANALRQLSLVLYSDVIALMNQVKLEALLSRVRAIHKTKVFLKELNEQQVRSVSTIDPSRQHEWESI